MTKQESIKREKEEFARAALDISRARVLAAQVAELLYAQEESANQKIIAAGIVFGAMSALHDIKLKDACTLLEGCYSLAEEFFDAAGPLQ